MLCRVSSCQIGTNLEMKVRADVAALANLLATLRQRAELARVDLLGALGANYLAGHEPARAIPLLERADRMLIVLILPLLARIGPGSRKAAAHLGHVDE